jgi:mono/diheme cytochrome c family protein
MERLASSLKTYPMKKLLLAFCIIIVGFVSCTEDGSPLLHFFNTDNLTSQFFDINTDADTVLHTKNGATITIAKGSIAAGNSKTVKLEVKEAYTMEEIAMAGLQTKSDGKPLSSGGMIYLNVKSSDARITSPIHISMPSSNNEKEMQLFKGEQEKDGSINWKAPEPLLPNKVFDTIAEGKNIFLTHCGSCHNPLKDATGPALMFITQRLNKEWIRNWVHNSAAMIASGDPYANCVYERWNKTAMTAFPQITDDELEKIYKYLDQVCKNKNPADYPNYKAAFDSCQTYHKAKHLLTEQKVKLMLDNGPEVKEEHKFQVIDTSGMEIAIDTTPFEIPRNYVQHKYDISTYHEFNITTFGWYNVDAFTNDIPGFEASTLRAKVVGKHNEFTNIYIIVPSSKIFNAGGLLKGEEDVYGFYTDDGNLPLPQGKEAYVMAFTEKGDQITFGMTRFITGTKNEVTITPQLMTKEEMNQKIKNLNFEALSIEARDAKNGAAIKKVNIDLKNIESLKPKGEDCNCGLKSDSLVSETDFIVQ